MNVATPTVKLVTRVSRPIEEGIMIREPLPQAQTKQQIEAETSDEDEDRKYKCKGKKKLKKDPTKPSRDSTPSPLKRAKKEVAENKLREEAWLQKQRNMAIGVGASEQRSSIISLD